VFNEDSFELKKPLEKSKAYTVKELSKELMKWMESVNDLLQLSWSVRPFEMV